MRIKDVYQFFPLRVQDQCRSKEVHLREGDIIINLKPSIPWYEFTEDKREQVSRTAISFIMKPVFQKTGELIPYPPVYICLLPVLFTQKFTGQDWMSNKMSLANIKNFEFPHPPPKPEEIEKLKKLLKTTEEIVAAHNKAGKLLDRLAKAFAHRMIVEGKPLKKEDDES